jgi:hypothetical protein
MYKQHGWAKPPNDPNVSIWRYFRLNRFIDLVEHGQSHFARLDQFPDQFEGVLPPGTVALAKDGFRDEPRNLGDELTDTQGVFREINRIGRLNNYANCWYMSDYESEAMWRLVGDVGVAIQSTFARLCASLASEPKSVYVGEMQYFDYRSEQPPTYGNTTAIAFFKRKEFEHERELRAVVVHPLKDRKTGSLLYEEYRHAHPRGFRTATDLDMLIERVVLAPGHSLSLKGQVVKMMERSGLEKPVTPSSLDDLPTLI